MRHASTVLGLLVLLSACGGSNPYSHGREYVPLDDEDPFYARAADVTYEDVRRDPQGYSGTLLGWFGTAVDVKRDAQGERAVLSLELRIHQARHLCTDQFDDSCRVTVSEKAGGPFTTTVTVKAGDRSGPERLQPGSLVRVYGKPTGELDERGGPIVSAEWYRQWPPGAYVTTSGNVTMRR